MLPMVAGVNEVVGQDDNDADDNRVLHKAEDVIGGTIGIPRGAMSVACRSAAAVLEVGKTVPREVAQRTPH